MQELFTKKIKCGVKYIHRQTADEKIAARGGLGGNVGITAEDFGEPDVIGESVLVFESPEAQEDPFLPEHYARQPPDLEEDAIQTLVVWPPARQ